MTSSADLFQDLAKITDALKELGREFALVGGLAVSVRAEVRFTRDIDIAVHVVDDSDAEDLVFRLTERGYRTVATVEHTRHKRLATARLESMGGVAVDLIFSNCGIEKEIVGGASSVRLETVGLIPIASVEQLLAMKILSMTPLRLQDRIDARSLLETNPNINLDKVRAFLDLITERGFERGQDLRKKLNDLLEELRSSE